MNLNCTREGGTRTKTAQQKTAQQKRTQRQSPQTHLIGYLSKVRVMFAFCLPFVCLHSERSKSSRKGGIGGNIQRDILDLV